MCRLVGKDMYSTLFLIILKGFKGAFSDKLSEFVCVDGTEISLDKVCDGQIHCPDGSDEVKDLCYHIICPHDMFRCHYGACVHQVTKCNGKFECADKSDESQCGKKAGSCEKNEFRCTSGQCIDLEKMCDEQEDCGDGSDETKDTCEELPCPENSFHCKHGGCIHLEARCNGYQDCIDGSDESEQLCKSMKCPNGICPGAPVTCPPITSSRILVSCESHQQGIVPCDKPVPAGTIAKFECRPHYRPSGARHPRSGKALCQLDGGWSRAPPRCEPECGAGAVAAPLVVRGWKGQPGAYPWHATLFAKEEGKWVFWCGGTLVSEKAVLTAGHCTWKINAEDIKVGLGKFHSDIDKNEEYTQIKPVKRIVMQPLYQDISGNYGSDLAILELETSVDINQYISPICLDWDQHDIHAHLSENSKGLIVGMGVNENETFSDTIRGTYLPVVSNEKCMKEQKQDFRKYITYTSFCAGWNNGTGVCNGDSGGGLVFPKMSDKNVWVLEGVVSISPRRLGTSFCDPQYYTVFTKVGIYLNWIKKVLDSIHPDRLRTTGALESIFTG